jgi:hypothetical protein
MLAKPSDISDILAAISSYELQFRCSLAYWNRMDESYDTKVLNLDFKL